MRVGTLVLFCILAVSPAVTAPLSDAQVRQAVIQQSLASYPGNCPCPYNMDRRGRSCGRRSAFSRPGGYAPICYAEQVTPGMIAGYRRAHGVR